MTSWRPSANGRRGEVSAVIGGRPRRLCLTLGALAELETTLGAEDLAALGRRFGEGRLATRDLLVLLAAGLRGAGEDFTPDELESLPLAGELPALVAAAARLLDAAFGTAEEGRRPGPPPAPQAP